MYICLTLYLHFVAEFNLLSAQNVLLQHCNISRTSPWHDTKNKKQPQKSKPKLEEIA